MFCLRNARAVRMQLDIIANATAKSASRVLHHGQFHVPTSCYSPLNLTVRTGRNDKSSAQRSALTTPARAPRHVPPGGDLLPRLLLVGGGLLNEMRTLF